MCGGSEPGLRTAASRARPAWSVRVMLAETGRRTPRARFRRRPLGSEGRPAQQAGPCVQLRHSLSRAVFTRFYGTVHCLNCISRYNQRLSFPFQFFNASDIFPGTFLVPRGGIGTHALTTCKQYIILSPNSIWIYCNQYLHGQERDVNWFHWLFFTTSSIYSCWPAAE